MFRAWWGRMRLYCLSHALIAVWACFVVTNHSVSKISRLSNLVRLFIYYRSQVNIGNGDSASALWFSSSDSDILLG